MRSRPSSPHECAQDPEQRMVTQIRASYQISMVACTNQLPCSGYVFHASLSLLALRPGPRARPAMRSPPSRWRSPVARPPCLKLQSKAVTTEVSIGEGSLMFRCSGLEKKPEALRTMLLNFSCVSFGSNYSKIGKPGLSKEQNAQQVQEVIPNMRLAISAKHIPAHEHALKHQGETYRKLERRQTTQIEEPMRIFKCA